MPGLHHSSKTRELVRRVQADCCVEVDGNAYSMPWQLVGEGVMVEIGAGRLRITHAGREIAVHAERSGRRERVLDPCHFEGIAGLPAPPMAAAAAPPAILLRPLARRVRSRGWRRLVMIVEPSHLEQMLERLKRSS